MSEPEGDCAHFQRQLLLLRDADRSGHQPAAVVEHLEACPSCRDEYTELVEFEENLHRRLEAGDRLTDRMDQRLRQRYRAAVHRIEGTHRARHFATRTWRSVLATAAVFLIAFVVVFVANPDLGPVVGSIYSSERSGADTLTKGAEYRVVLESEDAAWVYLINVDATAATLIFPYRTEGGLDYLGYPGARIGAGERRVVPHLDSGMAFTVKSPPGATEHFFVAAAASEPSLEDVEASLVSLDGRANVRAWLEAHFDAVSEFAFEVE